MADGCVKDIWRLVYICLVLLHSSTHHCSNAHPIVIQKENICLLVCPANMPSCDLCRQLLPLLETSREIPTQRSRLRLLLRRGLRQRRAFPGADAKLYSDDGSRRSYCDVQCAQGLYSYVCSCGHDPTRKRSSPPGGSDMSSYPSPQPSCFQQCSMGRPGPDCNCNAIREEFTRHMLQRYPGRKPDCPSLCSVGMAPPMCQCPYE